MLVQSIDPSAVAYSYIRFSTPEQARGDSLRRQTEAAAEWCKRNGVPLDTSLTLRDLGKSAFMGKHRSNPDTNALAAFLKLAEQGKIPRGSYLVIENLDRLTREKERDALRLWMDILDLGINIVQLTPETIFRHEQSDMVDIIRAIIELSRGHRESALKSERVGEAWAEKKRRAREKQAQKPTQRMGEASLVTTHNTPHWIKVVNGKPQLIPDRAAAIKRVFELARSGLGYVSIIKRLESEKLPSFGRSGRWSQTYIVRLLNDRRVLGEYQPRKRDKSPDGPPIPDHWPAVVTQDEYDAAGRIRQKRDKTRVGKYVNLFPSLLRNARNGDSYMAARKTPGYRTYVSVGVQEGRSPAWSFPVDVFDNAILSCLREIDPHDILNGDTGPDATVALAAEYARIEAELADATAFMEEHGFSATIGKRVQALEAQKRTLGEQLSAARQQQAHPLSEAWGETRTLAGILATAPNPDEVREQLRTGLRRIIEEGRLLVVARARTRLCAVQLYFADRPVTRSYLILYRVPSNRRKALWWCRSLAEVIPSAGPLDLRNPDHVNTLEAALLAWTPPQD